jgi:hypothetical protein
MKFFKDQISQVLGSWNWFWFESRSNEQLFILSVFRVVFCAVMLFFFFTRAFDVDFFYSDTGVMPLAHRASLDYFKYHPTFLTLVPDGKTLQWIHSAFLLCLLSLLLGFKTRVSAILTYFMHMMFINRNISVMFGVDMIGTFFFLYLCFANSGAYFSLDSWMKKSDKKQGAISHIAWRLMQVQICVIYSYSGMEKLKGTRWWDGSAIWDVLSMGTMQRWDLSFVAHIPILLSVAVYVVLFWEVYFAILIWNPKFRLPMLFYGFIMHLGIFLFMNLPSFGFMMISMYLLFLKKSEVVWILKRVPLLKNFIPSHN